MLTTPGADAAPLAGPGLENWPPHDNAAESAASGPRLIAAPSTEELASLAQELRSATKQLGRVFSTCDALAVHLRDLNSQQQVLQEQLAAREAEHGALQMRLQQLETASIAARTELARVAQGLQSQQAEQLRTLDLLSESLESLLPPQNAAVEANRAPDGAHVAPEHPANAPSAPATGFPHDPGPGAAAPAGRPAWR
jgi:septal ring factor EnvC (AmiA/AmiB activator)